LEHYKQAIQSGKIETKQGKVAQFKFGKQHRDYNFQASQAVMEEAVAHFCEEESKQMIDEIHDDAIAFNPLTSQRADAIANADALARMYDQMDTTAMSAMFAGQGELEGLFPPTQRLLPDSTTMKRERGHENTVSEDDDDQEGKRRRKVQDLQIAMQAVAEAKRRR